MGVLWTHGVNTGRLTRTEFVAATSANAAKIFNMYPRKGLIAAGSDADIVLWDPKGTRVISKDTHHQNIDFNIYEGMELTGIPAMTWMRGKLTWNRGELLAEKGWGKYIDRPTFAPYWESVRRRNGLAEPTAVKRKPIS